MARTATGRANGAPGNTIDGRRRVVIDGVSPEVANGAYPAKAVVGESFTVEANIFADGHDAIVAILRSRRVGQRSWRESRMIERANDRWRGSFDLPEIGRYEYTILAWVDPFLTWQRDLAKRVAARQDIAVELEIGAGLLRDAAGRTTGRDRASLQTAARTLVGETSLEDRTAAALDPALADVSVRNASRDHATEYSHILPVWVEPARARFSAWYELFPRSTAGPGEHGTFKDCEARLPYIADMGFDILYLPPIHPIGHSHRKGANNALRARPIGTGSPWAIGNEEGGHMAVNPALGTIEDFRHLVTAAAAYGIDVAIDIAFQCSPNHPYIREHPQWFRHRPDGSIRHAENPPKTYEDIVPFDFETDDWRALWAELKRIVLFWIEQGISVFRVDNPHTKPFPFWEWLIDGVKKDHPETIFLSEAFTRPNLVYRLAMLGFTQSYTYFAWRNTRWELTEYLSELAHTSVKEFCRPNLWPNTPDILTEYLQFGGRPAFAARVILAATLSPSYGIYGPAFELCESAPREPGSEEYLDSEKYQLRHWELDQPHSLAPLIARINRIRRESPALQRLDNIAFHDTDNEELICYSKLDEDSGDAIVAVVNLDPHHTQSGWVSLDLERFGLGPHDSYQMHDLLSDARYLWNGPTNYVEVDPRAVSAHLFRLRRRVKTEHDFEYYL